MAYQEMTTESPYIIIFCPWHFQVKAIILNFT